MSSSFLNQLDRIAQGLNETALSFKGASLSWGSLLVAFILIVFTARISRMVTNFAMRRVVEPFVPQASIRPSYQRLIFISCILICIISALHIAGIPLTAFTVLGGALAIGVGFASQNILSNFISGIIMMIERPIRVGDRIQIEGVEGRVTEIGTRSTKVRTVENKHWIVPNSAFLEQNVLNWTLVDSVVRMEISVGVAHRSDVQLVRRVAQQVLAAHEVAEKVPAPRVVFESFGDSSLNFKLQYWFNIDRMSAPTEANSELRFALDKALREANIEVAYPQRDIHVRPGVPLDIRMLKDEDGFDPNPT